MNIITARNGRLWDGDAEFRFLGLAAPNLHLNECQVYPDYRNRFPDDYEIIDTLESIKQSGGLATRLFCLSLATDKDPGLPCHIHLDGSLNEEAFVCLDKVLYHGERLGIRIIIPLIDSHSFPGWRGVDEWAAHCGKKPGEFWTHTECKDTWKKVIQTVLTRRNTVTGRPYFQEPSILAWQLGNELDSWPADRSLSRDEWMPLISSWSLEIAETIRGLDPNHLIMEGGGLRNLFLESPFIDVLSDHYYEYWNVRFGKPGDLACMNKQSMASIKGVKPLIADEFGMASVQNMRGLLEEIRVNGTSGALLWSIRSHRRDGGFYHHNENGSHFNAYHWPGFPSGDSHDEQTILKILHAESYAIRGLPAKVIPAPDLAPQWLGVGKAGTTPEDETGPHGGVVLLRWRGVCGGRFYEIQRRPRGGEHGWLCLTQGCDDAPVLDTPLLEAKGYFLPFYQYCDLSTTTMTSWEYRIRGGNETGWGPWSETREGK